MVTRTTFLRLGQLTAAALLATALGGEAHAQSLTIGGSPSVTSQPGVDFATSVLGDPWDFDQRTDDESPSCRRRPLSRPDQAGPAACSGTSRSTRKIW
jgi:hypothetical protein